MAELPKGKKFKRKPRSKVAFKADGTPNKAATTPFYVEDNAHHHLYDKQAWRRIRKTVLAEYPTCPVCMQGGSVVPATDVDHITAHKGDTTLFYDPNNLWALCKACHAKKSAHERNGTVLATMLEWVKLLIGTP